MRNALALDDSLMEKATARTGLGYVDAHLVYPITSPHAVFALDANVAPELGTKVALRWLPADGSSHAMVFRAGGGPTELNPTHLGAAMSFVGMGVRQLSCASAAFCRPPMASITSGHMTVPP